MMKISRYLDPNLILFLDKETRDETLLTIIDTLKVNRKLEDPDSFYNAILKREQIVSTGIGMGVAIPHAKLPTYDDFFIVIAILQKGVDWGALDNAPVRLVFLIGGPDDKQTEYLQILSRLTFAIKDEDRRKKMLTMNSPTAIIDLLKGF